MLVDDVAGIACPDRSCVSTKKESIDLAKKANRGDKNAADHKSALMELVQRHPWAARHEPQRCPKTAGGSDALETAPCHIRRDE